MNFLFLHASFGGAPKSIDSIGRNGSISLFAKDISLEIRSNSETKTNGSTSHLLHCSLQVGLPVPGRREFKKSNEQIVSV